MPIEYLPEAIEQTEGAFTPSDCWLREWEVCEFVAKGVISRDILRKYLEKKTSERRDADSAWSIYVMGQGRRSKISRIDRDIEITRDMLDVLEKKNLDNLNYLPKQLMGLPEDLIGDAIRLLVRTKQKRGRFDYPITSTMISEARRELQNHPSLLQGVLELKTRLNL